MNNSDSIGRYEIIVKGKAESILREWFEDMSIGCDGINTTLQGTIKDQSALRGVLDILLNLNLEIISVNKEKTK